MDVKAYYSNILLLCPKCLWLRLKFISDKKWILMIKLFFDEFRFSSAYSPFNSDFYYVVVCLTLTFFLENHNLRHFISYIQMLFCAHRGMCGSTQIQTGIYYNHSWFSILQTELLVMPNTDITSNTDIWWCNKVRSDVNNIAAITLAVDTFFSLNIWTKY